MVASDKLFYWLFQQRAERLQPFVASLLPRMEGYVFSAPVLKEREYRLDGLVLPPADQHESPTLILEAQMGPDPDFLLRLKAETGCLLQQQQRQGRPIRQWQVVVICPSRELNFSDPTPASGVCGEAGGVDRTAERAVAASRPSPATGAWDAAAA